MAVPTLTALEEEKKQAQAADEDLQVFFMWLHFCAIAERFVVFKRAGTAHFAA